MPRYTGLVGVRSDERPEARLWGRRLEWPMIVVALWIPFHWLLGESGVLAPKLAHSFDVIIWLFFLFETAFLTYLVRDKRRYLLDNWVNLVIIGAGIPLLVGDYSLIAGMLRALRAVLVLGIFVHFSKTLRTVLARNSLGATLVFSLLVVVVAGLLISRLDPGIKSLSDGMWWAWVTVTTVGYGDVVPTTVAGRLFGSLIILLGVAVFALLTANISAFLIGRDTEKEEAELRGRLKDIQSRVQRIEELLAAQQESTASKQAREDQ